MCTCQHKMHWSVVAILVNLLAVALYTTAVASHHWAIKTDAGYSTHAGLFTACPKINDNCYDTHYHFNEYSHGFLAAIGIAMYAVGIKRLDNSLSWSFAVAVLGLIVNMAAGILMCVGRNISKMAADEEKPMVRHPIEDINLDVTRRKQWREGERPEFGGELPRKKTLPGASE